MAATNQQTSPLLSLPPELRKNIYRKTVTSDAGRLENTASEVHKHTAILQISRQIRNEANAIFYTENTFHVTLTSEDGKTILAWLSSIGANVKLITGLAITLKLWDATQQFDAQWRQACVGPRDHSLELLASMVKECIYSPWGT